MSAQLPSPPVVSAPQKAVEGHLRERYEAAMKEPSSIAAVGQLCLAYHADMFFDAAERCYAAADQLVPGEWRWTYYRAVIQESWGAQHLAGNLGTFWSGASCRDISVVLPYSRVTAHAALLAEKGFPSSTRRTRARIQPTSAVATVRASSAAR